MAPLSAQATPESARKMLSDLVKAEPKAGKVQIKTQEIAENGNTVPVTIVVDSPMTEKDYVKAIHVVADKNPLPGVASFNLFPASGKAEWVAPLLPGPQFRFDTSCGREGSATSRMTNPASHHPQ